MISTLLNIQNIHAGYGSKEYIGILDGIDFQVKEGESVAVVGESGSGKSLTALSILGLLPSSIKIKNGSIKFNGIEITKLNKKEINKIRGKEISMVFQEPLTSLNPSFTIGNQLKEVFKYHTNYTKEKIKEKSIEVLKKVNLPDPEDKLNAYPHQLSGGMRQRVMIAMALACNPKLLIADEPTTALDVTIQAQILDLISELQKDLNMALIMITHDLGVVAETCERVIVMYAGQIVEESNVEDLFEKPLHPYTRGLMLSAPKIGNVQQKLHVIKGTVPDFNQMPKGCRFSPRCEFATDICRNEAPKLEKVKDGRRVRCWHKLD